MNDEPGIKVDDLAVGLTRPSMKWGVTYTAMVVNGMVSLEALIWTQKLQWFLIIVPIHAVFALICRHDPRAFELLFLWLKTKAGNLFRTFNLVSTYSPLARRKPIGATKRLQAGMSRRLRLTWRKLWAT